MVMGLCGADVEVVGDEELLVEGLEGAGVLVTDVDRLDALSLQRSKPRRGEY